MTPADATELCGRCGHEKRAHNCQGGQCTEEAGTVNFAPCGCPGFSPDRRERDRAATLPEFPAMPMRTLVETDPERVFSSRQ